MEKRKILFKVLKKKLSNFVKSDTFFFLSMSLFVILSAIAGFMIVKLDPIPLTEDEIEYYTNQAEVVYFEGMAYLDDNISVEYKTSNSCSVYDVTAPDAKQKLIVTFLDGKITNIEYYYSVSFLGIRILGALLSAILGFLVFCFLGMFISWIADKISTFKYSVQSEIEEEMAKLKDSDSKKTKK